MKKTTAYLLMLSLGATLVGCGDETELTQAQKFELMKMEKQHEHEEAMGRINRQDANQQNYSQSLSGDGGVESSVGNESPETYSDEYQDRQSGNGSNSDSGSGSFLGGVLAGAAAGYITSELLDDGYRSYTDSSGKSVYVDASGNKISDSQYKEHKKSHPVKSKVRETKDSLKKKAKSGYSKTKTAAKKTYGKAKTATTNGYNKAKNSKTGRKVRATTKRTARKAKRVVRKSSRKARR